MVTNDRTKDIGQTRGAGGERRIPADRIVPSINNDSTLNMLYSRKGAIRDTILIFEDFYSCDSLMSLNQCFLFC